MIGLSSRLLLLVAALEVSPPPPSRHPRVVGPGRKEQICVVGAGPAGVHMAYSLKKRGYSSVVVLERTDRVGGKCLDSHYRGVVWPLGAGVTVAHYSRNIIPLAAEFGFNDYTNAGNGSEFLGKVFEIGSKECYLLSFKALFLTTITKPPEVIVNKFFCVCVCFFLLVSIQ